MKGCLQTAMWYFFCWNFTFNVTGRSQIEMANISNTCFVPLLLVLFDILYCKWRRLRCSLNVFSNNIQSNCHMPTSNGKELPVGLCFDHETWRICHHIWCNTRFYGQLCLMKRDQFTDLSLNTYTLKPEQSMRQWMPWSPASVTFSS